MFGGIEFDLQGRLAMEGPQYGGDMYSLGIVPTQWSGSLTWRIPALEELKDLGRRRGDC